MTSDVKKHEEIKALQDRLSLIQHAYARQGRKAMIVLEGWDAAGKGGLIRRLAWGLDPRPLKVWRISAPSSDEKGAHWLRRFWTKVPGAGEIAVFDRSWYGRVLVERVEGYATESEWKRAYDEINNWEASLADEGYQLVKLFLDITPEEQLERFRDRYKDPLKRWKLTMDDLRNRGRWAEYDAAYSDMLARTSTAQAPWHRIDANSKHKARIKGMTHIAECLGKNVDVGEPPVQPEIAAFFEPG
jgi:AMP-polyphosphate phosphotransferase